MCHNQEEVVHQVCYHSVKFIGKRICAHASCGAGQWRLTAGKREHMWCVLQAVLPGKDHLLATNRRCGRRGPILVLDTDFGGPRMGRCGG